MSPGWSNRIFRDVLGTLEGDVLGTLEGDVLGTFWEPIFPGWVSSSFKKTVVDFNYRADISGFEKIIKIFQRKIETDSNSENDDNDNVNNILDEKTKMNKLIVMDDVSGLADKSYEFGSLLTAC